MTAERHLLRPPDLHALLDKYGSYPAITPEAWAIYDQDMATWRELHRRPQGAVLDDDPLAQSYAQQTGQIGK